MRRCHGQGFSLLETLVAVTILAFATLGTLAVVVQEPRLDRQLAAHHEATRLLTAQLELMRAGEWSPGVGEEVAGIGSLAWQPASFRFIELRTKRETLPARALWEVELTLVYALGPQIFERRIETEAFWP